MKTTLSLVVLLALALAGAEDHKRISFAVLPIYCEDPGSAADAVPEELKPYEHDLPLKEYGRFVAGKNNTCSIAFAASAMFDVFPYEPVFSAPAIVNGVTTITYRIKGNGEIVAEGKVACSPDKYGVITLPKLRGMKKLIILIVTKTNEADAKTP